MRNKSMGAILLMLATGTCGGSQRTPQFVRKSEVRSHEDVRGTLQQCVASNDAKCIMLCQQIFMPGLGQQMINCGHTIVGNHVTVSAELEEPFTPSGGGGRSSEPGCAPGRRPLGLACPQGASTSAIAAFFALSAQHEAASVVAFARIHRALASTASPALLAKLRAAIEDELAHARIMLVLARAHGVEPLPPEIATEPELSLVERAIENAVEGCVNETIAALHAAIIATAAPDPAVRVAFAQLVEDEGRHAMLAYELAAHYAPRLTAGERVKVGLAYRTARAAAVTAPPTPAMRMLGIPEDARLRTAIDTLLDAMPRTAVA